MSSQVRALHLAYLVVGLLLVANSHAQFWKMNVPNERDIFLMEVRSSMPSGICYKQETNESLDPALRMRTISYCCEGYRKSTNAMVMRCDPICTEDCENGICSAPDVCECYPGFARRGGRCEEL